MIDTIGMEEKPLEREHLFHLLMARNWLAIGSTEEARREFDLLPPHAQAHPEAREVRLQLEPETIFATPKE